MKFMAIVVLYNPSDNNIETINHIAESGIFEYIRVWDNSEKRLDYLFDPHVEYVFSGENRGLAYPYNRMIDFCVKKRCDFLCLLDQDSDYPIADMKEMMQFISAQTNHEKIAIYAPRSYSSTSRRRERNKNVLLVDFAINSGSFINISCVKKKKLRYDENIFLDGLDYDFGLQIKETGCQVLIYENSVLEQRLGYTGKNRNYNRHEAFRYYYITHNRRYILKKHYGHIIGEIISIIKNFVLVFKILKYEDKRYSKIKNSCKGWYK